MRTNFQLLADKFSTLNEEDNNDFISFYESNTEAIKNLKDFETDEELYLAVVVNHTYGRSQLHRLKDFSKAERFLDIARGMILEHKDKFKIELNEDIWYLQTLQHLLTTYLTTKDRSKAITILKELKTIDEDNQEYYDLEAKEIRRIRKYKILMAMAYFGAGLTAVSIIYRFFTEAPLWHLGRIGQVCMLVGLVGAYLFRNTMKGTTPNIVYKSRPGAS